ncbi:D-aminoacylase [Burkholderiaceae bacterium FT117]|uniref:N-acyl-D-amino-acid deacylase family protein n=1 Tax=Zeimonas sediminis TaxID=2944268 RepID=UPI0023431E11|nr:D-aminoacylase [Zeimonas sediminis]MCM5570105.1 D-aminoacylase [Zeimonas sediminis]
MAAWDLLLRGAHLIDGSGAPAASADVALAGGRIAAVGRLDPGDAASVRDLDGLALAPGFIDVHTHDDRLLLSDPSMTPKLSQGVTTVIAGNCGISLAPLGDAEAVPPINLVAEVEDGRRFGSFADYFAALDASPPSVNCAALVGHTTLRVRTMAALDRPATGAEIAAMQALVAEAIEAGAIGASTGTYYGPASAATADEIRRVLEPLRGSGALIASHIRDETDGVLQAMREAFGIAAELGVRQVISHHKLAGKANFGRSSETLALFDETRKRADVCLDCYPYAASSTILRADAANIAASTLVTWSTPRPEFAGRYLDAIAAELGVAPAAAVELLQPAGAIYFMMDEADVERILAYPETMVGSDGLPHDLFPHPRLWGAFPRVLGHYARERKLFPLETAVHKMTGLSAGRFGLAGRGLVRPGYAADLVVFDPDTVADTATFAKPVSPAAGIVSVFVNGVESWTAGGHTGARAGTAIRRGR